MAEQDNNDIPDQPDGPTGEVSFKKKPYDPKKDYGKVIALLNDPDYKKKYEEDFKKAAFPDDKNGEDYKKLLNLYEKKDSKGIDELERRVRIFHNKTLQNFFGNILPENRKK